MATETAITETIEPHAPVGATPDVSSVPGKPASASGKRGKKSKQDKTKAVAAAAPPTSKEDESNANNMATVDHPYLSFLHKRIRSYKKKLEKIKGLESAQAASGKVLNPQQLELVSNKALMEKMIAEFETLREQFIDVYLQVCMTSLRIDGVAAGVCSEEAVKKQAEEEAKVAAAVAVIEEEEEVEETPVEVEEEEEEPKESEVLEEPQQPQQSENAFANVQELLKTLHVVNLHQALGKEVPMVLDFFSKVLLGNTRPLAEVSYEENLAESLEEAKKYLAGSDKVFACDMSYSDLRAIVDKLSSISSASEAEPVEGGDEEEAEEELVVVTMEAETGPVESEELVVEAEALPEINFFTDSQLEPEEASLEEAEPIETVESLAVEVDEAVIAVTQEEGYERVEEAAIEEGAVEVEDQAETTVAVSVGPPSAPPMSFAAVAASSGSAPSPPTAWGYEKQEKETGSGGSSPREKGSQRRRTQGGRWKEKNRNNSTGNASKAGGEAPASGSKPRRSRPPRSNDEAGVSRSGSKDDRRPRADRAFRKQPGSMQPHSSPMIAPNA
ncbi:hypothetical protein BBJ28_00003854 [Nothophytophthora sp. Chile5]|nr:hypothetical protein BBJ28_00003854 [Nothophytophthora sp. Chile5]